MTYEIVGRVLEAGTVRGVPGVVVRAFDKDFRYHGVLGHVLTNPDGHFKVVYGEERFRSLFDSPPEIFLTVQTTSGALLLTTHGSVRFNAVPVETFRLEVPASVLAAAGLRSSAETRSVPPEKLTRLTCLPEGDEDELVSQIRTDAASHGSILSMFREYRTQLQDSSDNHSLALRKLERLFELGATFDSLDGHYYGVVPGLRSGDLDGFAADCGNLLGLLWGKSIGPASPWVGKSFTPMTAGDQLQVAGDSVPPGVPMFRGINHFNAIEHAPVNVAAVSILTLLWQLREVPEAERLLYGHDRNGGHFAAHRAFSVHPATPRTVFRLNYRYAALGNVFPLVYLVDEIVQVGDGLYLGQVLFATDQLMERYDAKGDPARDRYQNFGYFLLLDEDWNEEARRVFPHLEMPATTIRAASPRVLGRDPEAARRQKFSTLTLADPSEGHVDPVRLADVHRDLEEAGDVMRMLKSYSGTLDHDPKNRAQTFDKLHALFQAGRAPSAMQGFYRGARVTFQSHDLIAAFGVSSLNIVWQATRLLAPWTGARFDVVEPARLLEITEEQEKGDTPTVLGSNTVVFRSAKERLVRGLIEAIGAPIESASEEDRRQYGYEATCFYFIGRSGTGILQRNAGKPVYQLNYRWKALRTPPPDSNCMDQIVEIAEGLFLGQLIYATALLEPWSLATPVADYHYRSFGYFLLMDEEWHARRLRIGFDLDNT